MPDAPDPPAGSIDADTLAPTMARLGAAGITIDARTMRPDSDGARFDAGWAVDVLRTPATQVLERSTWTEMPLE